MTPFVEAARQIVVGLHHTRPGVLAHGSRDLIWRHHGLGMLQAEFSENLRIHLWHPSLVNAGMAWPRCVHDHRFGITSAVVIGGVVDVLCAVREVPEHPSDMESFTRAPWVHIYEIEHAKNQDRMVTEKGCSTATSAKRLARAYVDVQSQVRHRAGQQYRVSRRDFHTTRVEALAITVIHRSNFDDRLARVLCAQDKDVTAISGIVRDETPEHASLVESVVHEAAFAIAGLGA